MIAAAADTRALNLLRTSRHPVPHQDHASFAVLGCGGSALCGASGGYRSARRRRLLARVLAATRPRAPLLAWGDVEHVRLFAVTRAISDAVPVATRRSARLPAPATRPKLAVPATPAPGEGPSLELGLPKSQPATALAVDQTKMQRWCRAQVIFEASERRLRRAAEIDEPNRVALLHGLSELERDQPIERRHGAALGCSRGLAHAPEIGGLIVRAQEHQDAAASRPSPSRAT